MNNIKQKLQQKIQQKNILSIISFSIIYYIIRIIMAESDVVGEGSYGCVHKPALFCGNKTYASQSADKISKIMTKKHASKEMKEYVLIENADRALNYYLGKPTECNVSDNPINQQSAVAPALSKLRWYYVV